MNSRQTSRTEGTLIPSVHCVIPVRPRTYTSIHPSIHSSAVSQSRASRSHHGKSHMATESLCVGEGETQSVNERHGAAVGSD